MPSPTFVDDDRFFYSKGNRGWWLDWGEDLRILDGKKPRPCSGKDIVAERMLKMLGRGSQFCPPAQIYSLAGSKVTISRHLMSLYYNGEVLDCNFRLDEPAVTASRPLGGAGADPLEAPIHIAFDLPVRAAGAFVTGGHPALPGTKFTARFWALTNGNPTWTSFNVPGETGNFAVFPAPRGAPFAGASAAKNDAIREIAFDIVPTGPNQISEVVISHLYALS